MTDSRILPGARAKLVNPDGTASRDFYVFFRQLEEAGVSAEQIRELCIKLGSPDGTIANIPDNPAGIQSIIGQAPILAAGNTVSLATLTQAVGGELLGVTADRFGRVSESRPVVAGAGVTIDGTTNPAQIEISASGLTNPMTTAGDIITGGVGGTPQRLGIGAAGQVLTVVSGAPAWAASAGGVTDGDKGDITVSASGATWTIDNSAVTYAKIQNVSATDRILGRSTAGAGPVQEITCTAFARTILDDTSAADVRTTIGATTNPMTTAGDIITGGTAGAPQRLGIGTAGQVLTVVSGAPAWAAAGGGGAWDGQLVMDSDFTVNSTTSQNVFDLSKDIKFTPLTSSVYEFEAICLIRSDDTTVGARPGIRWPTDAEGGCMVIAPNSNTAAVFSFRTAFDLTQPRADTTTFPTPASGRQFAWIRGILTTTAFTSGDLWLTMAGETTASIIMGRGSTLRWKKLA